MKFLLCCAEHIVFIRVIIIVWKERECSVQWVEKGKFVILVLRVWIGNFWYFLPTSKVACSVFPFITWCEFHMSIWKYLRKMLVVASLCIQELSEFLEIKKLEKFPCKPYRAENIAAESVFITQVIWGCYNLIFCQERFSAFNNNRRICISTWQYDWNTSQTFGKKVSNHYYFEFVSWYCNNWYWLYPVNHENNSKIIL